MKWMKLDKQGLVEGAFIWMSKASEIDTILTSLDT